MVHRSVPRTSEVWVGGPGALAVNGYAVSLMAAWAV